MTISLRGRLAQIFAIVFALGYFALFTAFGVNSYQLGGDALSGRVSGGHYYVSYKGVTREVTRAQWEENRSLALSFIISAPFLWGGVALLIFVYTREFATSIGIRADAAAKERAHTVRLSGACVMTKRIRGKLGSRRISFAISLHPAGLILKAQWMPEVALRWTDIQQISRIRRSLIQIDTTDRVRCPIRLFMASSSQFAQALAHMSGHPVVG